jgi:hypothetical protein
VSNDSGLYIRWKDIWTCLGAVLQSNYNWLPTDILHLQELVDAETQKQLNTLTPLESDYVRIDYTYGGSRPPVYFDSIKEAQEEIPTQGGAVIFPLGKSGATPQVKWWYSSHDKEWKYGKVTG